MKSKMNKVLGITAALILIVSFSMFAYIVVSKAEIDTITINGKEYDWSTLFEDFKLTTMEDKESKEYEGVLLSELIEDAGVRNPASHEYKIVSSDGYTKTVDWSDMETGLLLKDGKRTFFPTLPKAFWVKDVVKIEVV